MPKLILMGHFGHSWALLCASGWFEATLGNIEPKNAQNDQNMPNKAQNGQIKKFNVCTLETQMSKPREDFRRKGNPKIIIKTPVRTKFQKVILSGKPCRSKFFFMKPLL